MKLGSFESEMIAHECVRLEKTDYYFLNNSKKSEGVYAIQTYKTTAGKQYLRIYLKTAVSHILLCDTSLDYVRNSHKIFEIHELNNSKITDFYFPDNFQLTESWMRSILEVEMDVK